MAAGKVKPPAVLGYSRAEQGRADAAEARIDCGMAGTAKGTIVKQWCLDHRAELAQNWVNAQALKPLSRIAGADND
jgi:hypothetical protein